MWRWLILLFLLAPATLIAQTSGTVTGLSDQWYVINNQAPLIYNTMGNTTCMKQGNVSVSGGNLVITDAIQSNTCGGMTYGYTSGVVFWNGLSIGGAHTFDIQVKMQFTGGQGPWDAIWLQGANCQWLYKTSLAVSGGTCPAFDAAGYAEIDIDERPMSSTTNMNQGIHMPTGDPNCMPAIANMTTQQHVYELIWIPGTSVTWKVDGTTTCSESTAALVPNQQMFFLIDQTLGGYGGSITDGTLPQSDTIDYVRVTQDGTSIFDDEFNNTTAYGMTFSNNHPRLFWNSAEMSTAQAWVNSTSYAGVTAPMNQSDLLDALFTAHVFNGMPGLSSAAATAAANAITFVTGISISCSTGAGCDDMRNYGEDVMLALDWLAPGCSAAQCLTTSQFNTLYANWNTWMANQDNPTQTWGNIGMPANNYFASQFRNDTEFGIATYTENASADGFLAYGVNKTAAANTRWNDLLDAFLQSGNNGIDTGNANRMYAHGTLEGAEYGRYDAVYPSVPLSSSALLGRDLWKESTGYQGDFLSLLYGTSAVTMTNSGQYAIHPWADDQNWPTANDTPQNEYWESFANAAAQEYPTIAIGKLARTYLTNVGSSSVHPMWTSIDPGGSSQAFSSLPLDYYASGPQFMYLHDNWTSTGTDVLWQLGSTSVAGGFGHFHFDTGTFQVMRKGAYLIRETPGYSDSVAGYNDVGTQGTYTGFAHNIPLVGGQATQGTTPAIAACQDGPGVVRRLETQTGYGYSDTDLTLTYQNNVCDGSHSGRENLNVVHVEREFWYFRTINVIVVLDRLQTTGASTSTTFTSHCEVPWTLSSPTAICIDTGQEAKYFALVPAAPSMVSVNETDNSATCAVSFLTACQYRLESNNANPGNVVSYSLYAIQLGDSSGFSSLSPSVMDSNAGSPTSGTFTVTLDANNSIVINKGTTSSGGTIRAAGVGNALATTVETMTVTDAGPVWSSANVSPSGVHFGLLP